MATAAAIENRRQNRKAATLARWKRGVRGTTAPKLDEAKLLRLAEEMERQRRIKADRGDVSELSQRLARLFVLFARWHAEEIRRHERAAAEADRFGRQPPPLPPLVVFDFELWLMEARARWNERTLRPADYDACRQWWRSLLPCQQVWILRDRRHDGDANR